MSFVTFRIVTENPMPWEHLPTKGNEGTNHINCCHVCWFIFLSLCTYSYKDTAVDKGEKKWSNHKIRQWSKISYCIVSKIFHLFVFFYVFLVIPAHLFWLPSDIHFYLPVFIFNLALVVDDDVFSISWIILTNDHIRCCVHFCDSVM